MIHAFVTLKEIWQKYPKGEKDNAK